MATMMMASSLCRLFKDPQIVTVGSLLSNVKADGTLPQLNYCLETKFIWSRTLIHCGSARTVKGLLVKPLSAVGSGLEASITDLKDNVISIKDVEIVVESKDDDMMRISVEVSGAKTEEIYDQVFSKMVEDAQPIPGFRRVKGGKTPNIPKDILLEILGPSKVYTQVIKKVINVAISEYVAKEDLGVAKDLQIEQSLEDLEAEFEPGAIFKFDALLQFQDSK